MHIQLWSYNYAPEPSGIAPLSAVWAKAMQERGHRIEVVAAHPHYPEPLWGQRVTPYREVRDGIPVRRLPLWIGRATALERIRQELTFTAALTAALPVLGRPDAIVAVSPSFPALAVAMFHARVRRIPWTLWLQDILPDGAAATGIISEGHAMQLARRFERAAYRSADRIVVISESFAANLQAKAVPSTAMTRIFNPASRPIRTDLRPSAEQDEATVLTMGNIGHTQNLVAVTRAFQESSDLERLSARFVMAGDGVAGDAVRAEIKSDRVRVTGVIHDSDELEREMRGATVALVTQSYEGIDFNVPSKLMNFMGYGIPVVASVRADSEVARIVSESGGGWVTDSADLATGMETLARVLEDPAEREKRGSAALKFAQAHFSPEGLAERFEQVLERSTWSR